jgi:small subunit ribosomal protein S1
MTENFAELFQQSLETINAQPGAVVKAIVVDIQSEFVLVDAGLKSEGLVPRIEFGKDAIAIGDEVEVVVKKVENGFGETRLSYEEAKRVHAWRRLEKCCEDSETVIGVIVERVKGGFTVELDAVRAFLPGSLVDVKPIRDPGYLEGKELEFKIIKMDQKRNNIVVSRRAVMEEESSVEREARLSQLQEGQEVTGVVKNVTDYGAFVDLGGVDGLLHITDMAWKRVKHPSELLTMGDEIRVKILKFDREKNRVSLGMKQLGEDPWVNIERRYPVNTRVFGKITNVTDYGCFVQLEEGVEGLVHMSELDWTNKNVHPSKVVQSGEELEVMILDINEERRRISLGIKQCKRNPWDEFSETHAKGEKIKGNVRSITDFGVFIGLDGSIDGLIHLSDLSWTETGEEAVRNLKKGDEIEAVILAIDPERERISLGVKQLESDPVSEFIDANKESVLKGTVKEVDGKQATIELPDGVTAFLRIADFSYDRIKDLRDELKEGDEIEVKAQSVDPKTRNVYVSRKVLEERPDSKGRRNVGEVPTATTLGDLLKEQMQTKDEE